jgi:polyhydroxyalkanoate synthesis repressor PhaR
MTEEPKNKIKCIKKYKNRRLYDLERSQYVTMEDLQTYILQDIDFRVVDAKTDKDLTNATLLQMFVELEAHSTQALSPKVLRQLIKLSQHPLSEHYKIVLEEMLSKIQDHFQPYMHNMQATTEFWVKQSEQMVQSWQDWLRKHGK